MTLKNGSVSNTHYKQYSSNCAHFLSEIDPETASSSFFANENVAKWAVLEQWHQYYMGSRMAIRQALSQSGAKEGTAPKTKAK